jgi:bifunctional non-homologous end joining protein LigD
MNVESSSEIMTLAIEMAATYYVFDILYLGGRNLQDLPLIDRIKIPSKVIIFSNHSSPSSSPFSSYTANNRIRISRYVEAYGTKLFEESKLVDLEGIRRYIQDSRSS